VSKVDKVQNGIGIALQEFWKEQMERAKEKMPIADVSKRSSVRNDDLVRLLVFRYAQY